MSYIINNSRGNIVAIVADGTVNTSATDLALVGRALTDYGTYENENYVYLLENFANSTAPLQPILGQLWYDSSTDVISAYNTSNTWTALASQDYVQAQKISPAFSGIPTATTAAYNDNSTRIATTAFVQGEKLSPVFTGAPLAPTAVAGTSNTQIATTQFVVNEINTSNALGTMSQQNANAVSITGGSITGIIDLAIADGGTGASTAGGARTNLGLGTMSTQDSSSVAITGGSIAGIGNLGASNVAITGGSITGITALPVNSGGTGSSTATGARTNLGAAADTTNVIAGAGLSGGGALSANVTLQIAGNSNGFGTRYVSTASPTGGVDGDIWYQI